MFDELLVFAIVDDLHREADNVRLINIANRSQKIQRRQRLVKLARRFGLPESANGTKNNNWRMHFRHF